MSFRQPACDRSANGLLPCFVFSPSTAQYSIDDQMSTFCCDAPAIFDQRRIWNFCFPFFKKIDIYSPPACLFIVVLRCTYLFILKLVRNRFPPGEMVVYGFQRALYELFVYIVPHASTVLAGLETMKCLTTCSSVGPQPFSTSDTGDGCAHVTHSIFTIFPFLTLMGWGQGLFAKAGYFTSKL